MLDLESKRWAELQHAYGSASDIPELLNRLRAGDLSAVDELFANICHQGSVYAASFAAAPHLVEIAAHTTDREVKVHALILVGSIAASLDNLAGDGLSADITVAYGDALPRARDLALATLQEPLGDDEAMYLLQAAAGLAGRQTLAAVLSAFVDEDLTAQCPSCEAELYICPDEAGLSVAKSDPESDPDTDRTPVVPGPRPGSASEADFRWLSQVGGTALPIIGTRLPYLFGSADCPECETEFSVLAVLANNAM